MLSLYYQGLYQLGAIEYQQDITDTAYSPDLCGKEICGTEQHFWGTLNHKKVYLCINYPALEADKNRLFRKICWLSAIAWIVVLAAVVLLSLAGASVMSFTAALAVTGPAILLLLISCIANRYIINHHKQQGALIGQLNVVSGTVPSFEIDFALAKKKIPQLKFNKDDQNQRVSYLPLILAIRQGKLEDPVVQQHITTSLQNEMSNTVANILGTTQTPVISQTSVI